MTSPEKIEELLNRFGQTISDLPECDTFLYAYGHDSRKKAKEMSFNWNRQINKVDHQADFICHQSDVIERLIDALKVAEKTASCEYCKKRETNCGNCFEFGCEGFEFDEQTL